MIRWFLDVTAARSDRATKRRIAYLARRAQIVEAHIALANVQRARKKKGKYVREPSELRVVA